MDQRIQTVLMHGLRLMFYVFPPFVAKGADVTVSCLMNAIMHIPPEVRSVRLQVDGKFLRSQLRRNSVAIFSAGGCENVNMAIQAFCGILVHTQVFEEVTFNRLPVG